MGALLQNTKIEKGQEASNRSNNNMQIYAAKAPLETARARERRLERLKEQRVFDPFVIIFLFVKLRITRCPLYS